MTEFSILGTKVDLLSLTEAVQQVSKWATDGTCSRTVAFSNVHVTTSGAYDPNYRNTINQCDLVLPDGKPLVWVGNLRNLNADRISGPDFVISFCQGTQSLGLRHFFYGGAEGVADRFAATLQQRFPGLVIAGTCSPPFRPLSVTEDEDAVRRINESRSNVVWIGLGCPKQEQWMQQHRDRVRCGVMLAVGQAFDIHAGVTRRAPVWMQHAGFEWFYRLLQEPKRLWKRYLIGNAQFLWLLARERFYATEFKIHERIQVRKSPEYDAKAFHALPDEKAITVDPQRKDAA